MLTYFFLITINRNYPLNLKQNVKHVINYFNIYLNYHIKHRINEFT